MVMRRWLVAVVLFYAALVGAVEPEDAARRALAQLVAHDFAGVHARCNAEMAGAVTAEQLAPIWEQYAGGLGAFASVESVQTIEHAPHKVVTLRARFARGRLDVRLAFDGSGKIAGLFFPPVVNWSPPPYAAADRIEEQALTIGAAPLSLPGKLTLPRGSGPFPVVVLVHGSGATDEDETVGPIKPFADLALGLAARGVAVLRYPKRTFAHPQAFAAPARYTVEEESIADARAAVALLAKTPKIDARRIYLLGHSLGGMLAPRIAAAEPRLAGIAILAGTTRPLEEVVLEQMKARGGPAQVKAAEESQRRIRDPKLAAGDWVDFLGVKIPASYWLDLRDYRPAEVAARLTLPILVLQGDRDIQVRRADYDGWQRALKGRPRARCKLYPTLTHLFVEGQGTLADYELPAHVAPQVIDDLVAFLK
jgi:dienelactone hydrolase